jgi:hypothetical protein
MRRRMRTRRTQVRSRRTGGGSHIRGGFWFDGREWGVKEDAAEKGLAVDRRFEFVEETKSPTPRWCCVRQSRVRMHQSAVLYRAGTVYPFL